MSRDLPIQATAMKMMKSICFSLQLSLLVLLSYTKIYNIAAFTIQNGVTPTTQYSQMCRRSSIQYNMVSDPLISSDSSQILDGNGVAFTEGCTIQIIKEVKAFHVAKKGFGSFDQETKSFIPLGVKDVKSTPRVDRCLILSKGVRGIAKKVYDIGEYDATAPIVARFDAGESLGGDLVSPVTFLMHFETDEVEVVEWVVSSE